MSKSYSMWSPSLHWSAAGQRPGLTSSSLNSSSVTVTQPPLPPRTTARGVGVLCSSPLCPLSSRLTIVSCDHLEKDLLRDLLKDPLKDLLEEPDCDLERERQEEASCQEHRPRPVSVLEEGGEVIL